MPERSIVIVCTNIYKNKRGIVIVHRYIVAITLFLNDESTGLAATRCFLMFFKK